MQTNQQEVERLKVENELVVQDKQQEIERLKAAAKDFPTRQRTCAPDQTTRSWTFESRQRTSNLWFRTRATNNNNKKANERCKPEADAMKQELQRDAKTKTVQLDNESRSWTCESLC